MPPKRDALAELTWNEILSVVENFDFHGTHRRKGEQLIGSVSSSLEAEVLLARRKRVSGNPRRASL